MKIARPFSDPSNIPLGLSMSSSGAVPPLRAGQIVLIHVAAGGFGSMPAGTVRKAYSAVLRARGGIPYYDWTVTAGKLPAGLTLDRFTGEISGVPTAAGSSSFTVSVREYTKGAAPATSAERQRCTLIDARFL